ncbi:FKBP12-interacting protein of 37 kDa [Lactuca sativa]|nr:FKBP12-interacting protein of 37 kDa [Lactuca sativa]
MILSLRESLENCKDNLATCQLELEATKSEIQKWHSAFQNDSYITIARKSKEKGRCVYSNHCKAGTGDIRFKCFFFKTIHIQSVVWELRSQLKPPSMQIRVSIYDQDMVLEPFLLKLKGILM